MTHAVCAGIDVSKSELEVATESSSIGTFPNTQTGIAKLAKRLVRLDVNWIIIESTGIYSRMVADELAQGGFTVAVVQPGRIKQFARSQGQLAKTDRIDARIIARFGQATPDLIRYQPPTNEQRHLRALVDRRDQLVEDRVREQNRLEAARDTWSRKDHIASTRRLDKAVKTIEQMIRKVVDDDEELAAKRDCLVTQKGIGDTTAVVLLTHMPELGTMNRQEVAALAGLAPFNKDSGAHSGRRAIFGGRARVRTALHMAALAAARWDQHLKVFYQRLKAAGKPNKVIRIAVARKIVIRLNTLLANHLIDRNLAEGNR